MVRHMSTATDDLLTSPEVGQILGKSARTVQRMADAKLLPIAQKLPGPNGAYLFRRSDVAALMAPSPPNGDAA